MAYRTGLLKAIGCKKGQNRFCPTATGRTGQNWAGCLTGVCARAAGRPAVVAAAVSLFPLSPLCTHILSAAVQNRDEKYRMREDMNCFLVLSTQKTKCILKKDNIFVFIITVIIL